MECTPGTPNGSCGLLAAPAYSRDSRGLWSGNAKECSGAQEHLILQIHYFQFPISHGSDSHESNHGWLIIAPSKKGSLFVLFVNNNTHCYQSSTHLKMKHRHHQQNPLCSGGLWRSRPSSRGSRETDFPLEPPENILQAMFSTLSAPGCSGGKPASIT